MDWSPAYSWLVLALLLSLAELTSGAMVLLALGIAAALTAAVTALGLALPWQLLGMAIFTGVLLPICIMVIRPRFSPAALLMAQQAQVWKKVIATLLYAGILMMPRALKSTAISTACAYLKAVKPSYPAVRWSYLNDLKAPLR